MTRKAQILVMAVVCARERATSADRVCGRALRWAVVLFAAIAMAGIPAGGATYYVDPNGSDTNDGLTQASAWKTVAKANASTFAAGDQILFKRGGVWNESLVPPSSGSSGNPIVFDAYGVGEAPTLTGYFDLSSAANWSVYSGNVWKAAITSPSMTYVLFGWTGSSGSPGSVWGTKFSSLASVVAPYQFYFSSNTLYLYSVGNPASYYGSVAAILMANGGSQIVDINGKSWLQIEHFRLTYFDVYGVRIRGASDHITIANVDSEGMIPAPSLPHGLYVNTSPAPADIKLYNVDANRNYDGIRVSGSGSANGVQIKNCRAYGNRNYGIEDATSTANTANYSYCHLYGNGIGVLPSTDTSGGTDGGNNIAAYTAPAVAGFQKYPARITLTVDDPGLTDSSQYVDSWLPQFDQRGLQPSIAVVTGYDGSTQMIPKFQEWINAGRDLNSHSWSHQYFQPGTGFMIKYTGSGSAATMTIAGNALTTTVTGGPGGENLSFDLTNPAYSTISSLVTAMQARSGYTVAAASCIPPVCTPGDSVTLSPVTNQDIKSATYSAQYRNASTFWVRYVGIGTAATMSVSGTTLTTTVTGGPGGENLSFDLTNAAYDTMSELASTINGRSGYQAAMVFPGKGAAHSIAMADLANQDIKSAAYVVQAAESKLEPDEMAKSMAWMNANLTGLPANRAYVYPGGQEDSSTEGYAVAAGYLGARGALSMTLVKDVYANGANIQNITSLGSNPHLQGLTAQQMDARIASLVWKGSVWGVPYGIFWHKDELTPTEIGNLLDALIAHGATVMTNTQLVNWLAGQTQKPGTTFYVAAATGAEADLRPTRSSPGVNAGADLGPNFALDLEGVDQRAFGAGWDIGAYVYLGASPFVVVVQ